MTDCKCEMCSDCFDGLKAQLAAERARADDLSRMVAAMGEVLRELREKAVENHDPRTRIALDAILSRPDVAAERGRWVSRDAIGVALVDGMRTERDAAIARAEKAEQYADWLDEKIARERDAAERSRDELGIQLAACQERLRLAMDAVRKLKAFRDGITFKVDEERGVHSLRSIALDLERLWNESTDALDALDAVPGDALSRDIGPALDRAHEASGVVTQKGGEK